ncbi:MAG: hypothetical protein ACYS8K_06990 [Planctomycetota bacterium]|jgi:phage FluMu protein Com
MSSMKCPGEDRMSAKAGEVVELDCPECGEVVEFWPGEQARACRKCGNRFARQEDSGAEEPEQE